MPDVIPFSHRATTASDAEAQHWPPLVRILFRFAFTYLILSALFWVFEFADKSTALLAKPYQAFWKPFARWTAVHIFHWSSDVAPNFVRDTRYLYALLTCFLVFSALVTLVWSILDRRRQQYNNLNHWLRVFIRYVLAYLLLHYGMDKIFLLQFPAPGLARLTERFGDYSPSSLMWAFIGSSTAYTIFGGAAEVLGAVLLFSRRTTTLGALIAFAVMFNVTIMDFSYDVAVKLLCLNILLMAIYLVIPDTNRLLKFFLLNRATQPARHDPPILRKSQQRASLAIKICVILFLVVPLTVRDWKSHRQTGAAAPHPPLYGLYEVEDFTLSGLVHPPLTTDSLRWRYVILETPNTIAIKHMDETLTTYRINYDPTRQQIDFDPSADTAKTSTLNVSQQTSGEMKLDGTFEGEPISAKLKKLDISDFTLVSRGFHWISETTFAR